MLDEHSHTVREFSVWKEKSDILKNVPTCLSDLVEIVPIWFGIPVVFQCK
jgi:hypothetical protein